MKNEVEYYKKFYHKYMNAIKNRRKNNSSVIADEIQ